jgi:hypothetical protein
MTKTHAPFAAPTDDAASLAGHLLHEMSRGMTPVWPTTERFARAMARGLSLLSATRGPEVARAVSAAPEGGPIDWDRMLVTA